jgi:hypothetical protein
MATVLATGSGDALKWIRGRLGVPFEQVGQLGRITQPLGTVQERRGEERRGEERRGEDDQMFVWAYFQSRRT